MKPLFIPLRTEYYNAFIAGTKRFELRRYGARWNEGTCQIGRAVTLSKGYGKSARTSGEIYRFSKRPAKKLKEEYQAIILDIYGSLDIDIALIWIEVYA